jgi:hypothetical protein
LVFNWLNQKTTPNNSPPYTPPTRHNLYFTKTQSRKPAEN